MAVSVPLRLGPAEAVPPPRPALPAVPLGAGPKIQRETKQGESGSGKRGGLAGRRDRLYSSHPPVPEKEGAPFSFFCFKILWGNALCMLILLDPRYWNSSCFTFIVSLEWLPSATLLSFHPSFQPAA